MSPTYHYYHCYYYYYCYYSALYARCVCVLLDLPKSGRSAGDLLQRLHALTDKKQKGQNRTFVCVVTMPAADQALDSKWNEHERRISLSQFSFSGVGVIPFFFNSFLDVRSAVTTENGRQSIQSENLVHLGSGNLARDQEVCKPIVLETAIVDRKLG